MATTTATNETAPAAAPAPARKVVFSTLEEAVQAPADGDRVYEVKRKAGACWVLAKSPDGAVKTAAEADGYEAERVGEREQLVALKKALAAKK